MSGVINKLVSEFKKVDSNVHNPEYDVLSTGEQHSSALISSMLNKNGIKSRSLLGWQVLVVTDCNYSKARIIEINPSRMKKLMKSYDVLVGRVSRSIKR